MTPPYDAIVLAGGAARRLGGRAKPALDVGGRPLVARVVDAVPDAGRVVLVGPAVPGVPVDDVVREDPPGSGPVAAVAAGLALVRAGYVAVLAGDLPFVTAEAVAALRDAAAAPGVDAAVAVDAAGQDQTLLAVWRSAALRGALAGADPPGRAVRTLYAGVAVARVRFAERGGVPVWFDVDTEEDLRRARERR